MTKTGMIAALALCVVLCGCTTPKPLKAPLKGPLMDRATTSNPLPAYALPDPKPHEGRSPKDAAAPS
jgi:hypothetical protein